MSLQGSLDTFALPDVLRLLAATKKTGHLRIEGSRGAGDVWCDAGHLVAAAAELAGEGAPLVEVVFELLRFPDGDFSFDTGETTADGGAPADVEPILEAAEELLAEWRTIEAVVPSVAAWVTLAPELPRAQVTLKSAQWRLLVSIGGGATVAGVGEAFGMGELAVSRAMKDLVETGLVQLDVTDRPGLMDTAAGHRAGEAAPEPAVAAPSAVAGVDDPLSAFTADDDDQSPDIARQLAQLGPDAARAVAAAANAETDEEREAALAGIEGDVDGEPINRGVLLKFLSSVRS